MDTHGKDVMCVVVDTEQGKFLCDSFVSMNDLREDVLLDHNTDVEDLRALVRKAKKELQDLKLRVPGFGFSLD